MYKIFFHHIEYTIYFLDISPHEIPFKQLETLAKKLWLVSAKFRQYTHTQPVHFPHSLFSVCPRVDAAENIAGSLPYLISTNAH